MLEQSFTARIPLLTATGAFGSRIMLGLSMMSTTPSPYLRFVHAKWTFYPGRCHGSEKMTVCKYYLSAAGGRRRSWQQQVATRSWYVWVGTRLCLVIVDHWFVTRSGWSTQTVGCRQQLLPVVPCIWPVQTAAYHAIFNLFSDEFRSLLITTRRPAI